MGAAAVFYTLITVTGGGSVSHSRGYDTLRMCQEAQSLAFTGETIEAYKAQDDAIAAAQKKYDEAFAARHPPHPPRTEDERRWAKIPGMSMGTSGDLYCGPIDDIKSETCGGVSVIKNGLIQYYGAYGGTGWSTSSGYYPDKGEWSAYQHGRSVIKYPTDVKVAECVVEPAPQ